MIVLSPLDYEGWGLVCEIGGGNCKSPGKKEKSIIKMSAQYKFANWNKQLVLLSCHYLHLLNYDFSDAI